MVEGILGSGNGSWPCTAEGEPYGRCAEWYETSEPWGEFALSKAVLWRCWCAMSCDCCSSADADTAAAAAAAAATTAALSLSMRLLMSMTPSDGGVPDMLGVRGGGRNLRWSLVTHGLVSDDRLKGICLSGSMDLREVEDKRCRGTQGTDQEVAL